MNTDPVKQAKKDDFEKALSKSTSNAVVGKNVRKHRDIKIVTT